MDTGPKSLSAGYLVNLMLFYQLPLVVVKKSKLENFPRSLYHAIWSPKWRAVYESDTFLELIIDAYAYYLWPHFKVPGWMESYSGYDPIWKTAHNLNFIYEVIVEDGVKEFVSPLTSQPIMEFPFPNDLSINFFAAELFQAMNNRYRFHDIVDVIKEHRAPEDYDARYSNAKISFYRKWYHTRAKTKVVYDTEMSEQHVIRNHRNAHKVLRKLHDPTEDWMEAIVFRDFYRQCNPIDQKIMALTKQGYKRIEIAEMLGYANHTPVTKRFQRLAKRYAVFSGE